MAVNVGIILLNNTDGVPPARLLLLCTSGSGKTQSTRKKVTVMRQEIARMPLPFRAAICARTGVASSLAGAGSKTIRSLFKHDPRGGGPHITDFRRDAENR